MDSKKTFIGETSEVSQQGTLAIELFLNENYRFRRNMLNGKVECLRLDGSKRAESVPPEPECEVSCEVFVRSMLGV